MKKNCAVIKILLVVGSGCTNFTCPPHKSHKECYKAAEFRHAECLKPDVHKEPGWKTNCQDEFIKYVKEFRETCP